jgi:hypothetical protein
MKQPEEISRPLGVDPAYDYLHRKYEDARMRAEFWKWLFWVTVVFFTFASILRA